jgi:hypothetical protein
MKVKVGDMFKAGGGKKGPSAWLVIAIRPSTFSPKCICLGLSKDMDIKSTNTINAGYLETRPFIDTINIEDIRFVNDKPNLSSQAQ